MILTFYSYKGGVGRSMALANVAELLYRVGLRVLMVDSDLEAPGLERFFPEGRYAVEESPGLIDLFLNYKAQMRMPRPIEQAQDGSWPIDTPNQYKIDIPRDKRSKGNLALLSAGKRMPDFQNYAYAVRTFDWEDFYQNWAGEQYVDWLRHQFELEADVVLIDSRTGVSEIGGISTYQLADSIVMLTAPNEQNIDGTIKMARDFTRTEVQVLRRYRPLSVLPVPARVEDRAETLSLNRFREDFIRQCGEFLPPFLGLDGVALWEMAIPYVPFYAFYELVAVREKGEARSDALRKAYATLTEAIARLAPPLQVGKRDIQAAVKENLWDVINNVGWYVGADEPVRNPSASVGETSTFLPPPGAILTPVPRCPYPGMLPYTEEEAEVFFGRDREVRELVQLLRYQRLILIVGASSVGKTSLLFAGLVPNLRHTSLWPSNYWRIATMRPGPRPCETLSNLLGDDLQSLARAVAAALATAPTAGRLCLIVDQFEEIFTLASAAERKSFMAALEELRASDVCAVVIAMQADFFNDLLGSNLWSNELSEPFPVAPLRGDALREAIERPAATVGVMFEAGLIERLLADAADEPGALPLVQETIVMLWPQMHNGILTHSSYEMLGSGARTFARRAEATYTQLSKEQQIIARNIFIRLVQFGEGRADTRRRQPVRALQTVEDNSPLFYETLAALAKDRLVIVDRDDYRGDRVVDLVHEGLISGWPRLQQWLSEWRAAEEMRRRLEDRAAEWERLGREEGGLLDEVELSEADHWLSSSGISELGWSSTVLALMESSRSAAKRAHLQRARLRLAIRSSYVMAAAVVAVAIAAGKLDINSAPVFAALSAVFALGQTLVERYAAGSTSPDGQD